MRHALQALTDELRRLKASGVKTVAVSDESVAALRRIVDARAAAGPVAASRMAAPRQPEKASVPVIVEKAAVAAGPVRAPKPYEPPPFRPAAPVVAPSAAVSTIPPAPTVTLPAGDKQTRWNALLDKVLNDQVCRANVRPGKKVVLGVGSLDARIMFVGEAPGGEEEIKGEPFVGPAGQLLTKMIQAMGLKREDVYIGNIMNWRPQMPTLEGREQVGNRPPSEDEMRYCLPFLRAQIEVVNPELLVALGSTAAQGLLGFGSFKALGEIRGSWREFAGKPLMVTYHPSYILRNQSNRSKRMIWEDLLKVMERAGLSISEKQRGFFLDK
jgi:uracil-DNA glycosylase